MALPASLSTCTVVGNYVDISGNPIRGSISFTPETILIERTLNVILIPKAITVILDATGSFSIVLPVTNDPDVSPQPFTYKITENFASGRTFSIALPISLAGLTVDIADLLPAVLLGGSAIYITTDQYIAILARYTTANATYVSAAGATTSAGVVAGYASDSANFATLQAEENARQLMFMGT